ncbi:YmdB family metallophosphoesterase [Patescibacteria group bacterium]
MNQAVPSFQHPLDKQYLLEESYNHLWDKKDYQEVLEKHPKAIIRPANYPKDTPGDGYQSFNTQSIIGSCKFL